MAGNGLEFDPRQVNVIHFRTLVCNRERWSEAILFYQPFEGEKS